MHLIRKGLRFGMLLQLAIGPMCLLVFNTSAAHGFFVAFPLVLAITLIDFLYITLSALGIGAVLNKASIKNMIKIFGALVLILFGVNMIFGALHLSLLPSIRLFSKMNGKSLFAQGLLLTASNPLTIIFWGGVFSTQVIENNYNKKELRWFASGCVLSTLIFLSFVACLGTVVSNFLTQGILTALNVCVGSFIIYFGIKLMLKRTDS